MLYVTWDQIFLILYKQDYKDPTNDFHELKLVSTNFAVYFTSLENIRILNRVKNFQATIQNIKFYLKV